MKVKSKVNSYFSKAEIVLWGASVLFIVLSFCIFDRENYLTLIASVVGASSLIFNAKGNFFGQILMIIFSILYGIISYTFSYYGEMITYLGMTAPMAIFSLISWLKNPYSEKRTEVSVKSLNIIEIILGLILMVAVTVALYFILDFFDTKNIIPGTISVSTSFAAAYLTFKRSEYYAVAYAANDIVLIVLWALAAAVDLSYISIIVCFVVFLINDMYGFINWRRIKICQNLS